MSGLFCFLGGEGQYGISLILVLIFAFKKRELGKNEKESENEVQKESLSKTAKALSFCGEAGTEIEPVTFYK